jgi:GT2 family glycosyltransferase
VPQRPIVLQRLWNGLGEERMNGKKWALSCLKYTVTMNEPLVSVLMTVYNREQYIAEAIESVLSSTYSNFELIVVDDQSSDKSLEIAHSFEKKDKRIRVYRNSKNLGQFQNRNQAARYANGKYIKYLDSDDLMYPHGLEVMVWAIEQFPEAAFAVSFPKPEDLKPYPIKMSPREAYREQFLGRGVMDVGPSGMIFNRSLFMEMGGFKEDGYVGNDTEIQFRMAQKHPIVKMPTSLIWWRQHEGQAITEGTNSNEYILNHFNLVLKFLKDEHSPLTPDERLKAMSRQKQHHARKIWSILLKKKDLPLTYAVWQKSGLSILELIKGLKPYV